MTLWFVDKDIKAFDMARVGGAEGGADLRAGKPFRKFPDNRVLGGWGARCSSRDYRGNPTPRAFGGRMASECLLVIQAALTPLGKAIVRDTVCRGVRCAAELTVVERLGRHLRKKTCHPSRENLR